jgi:hypothetical protein
MIVDHEDIFAVASAHADGRHQVQYAWRAVSSGGDWTTVTALIPADYARSEVVVVSSRKRSGVLV